MMTLTPRQGCHLNAKPRQHQQPAVGPCPKLSRKRSVEEYQRLIVDRIKRSLDRGRRQWESSLQQKADALVTSKVTAQAPKTRRGDGDDVVDGPMSSGQPTISLLNTESTRCSGSSLDLLDSRKGSVCSTDSARSRRNSTLSSRCYGSDCSKWTFHVDISDFVPNGEVLVRPEDDRLVLIGRLLKPEDSIPSRGRPADQSVRKNLVVTGKVDPSSIRAATSASGVMTLEVVVKDTDS